MADWRIEDGPDGLRLGEVTELGFESEHLTWADLMLLRLRRVQVFVLYFPSRFNMDSDTLVQNALRTFGEQVGEATSVSFWDPADPEFGRALTLFDVKTPPALILARGLQPPAKRTVALNPKDIYTISFTDPDLLGDLQQLAAAVNAAHEVLSRGDEREIAGYVRARSASQFLATVGRISAAALEVFVRLKPTLGLPGGVSLKVG